MLTWDDVLRGVHVPPVSGGRPIAYRAIAGSMDQYGCSANDPDDDKVRAYQWT